MKLGALNLEFAGESLLHPDFKTFLKYAVHKRDEGKIGAVGWTDNGMLFNQDIADLVILLKVDWINFSLDGIGKVNDNIRLGSKYSVIEQNVKYLLKKRGSAKKPTVLMNIVDYGKTEEQKLEFYREWVDLVDGIELIPSILPDNTWENKEYIYKKAEAIHPSAFCHIPLSTMKKIWNGSKFQNLRKAVVTNTFPLGSPCYKCEFWKVNFEPRDELILDGKAKIEYGGAIRKIRSTLQKERK
jgi:sulfatase maturation enzyme AslB (radical SAM superfamily)